MPDSVSIWIRGSPVGTNRVPSRYQFMDTEAAGGADTVQWMEKSAPGRRVGAGSTVTFVTTGGPVEDVR